jgi:hypothetical protein
LASTTCTLTGLLREGHQRQRIQETHSGGNFESYERRSSENTGRGNLMPLIRNLCDERANRVEMLVGFSVVRRETKSHVVPLKIEINVQFG